MDREKLNEAAHSSYRVFESRIAFTRGAEWLMQQPLADRLTEEEKERIKKLYLTDEEIEGIKTAFGTYPVAAATISKNMLEQIFGKELFNEK